MKILLFALVFCIVMIIPSAIAEEKVPNWVKNTVGWWANNLITDNEFVNAIEFLIKEGIIQIDAVSGEKSDNIPDWVRNTAGWWATDQISDTEFLNSIEFQTKEGISQVDARAATEKENNVPDWVRNTAGWWATDQISETEFLNAIEFLIESGIISISNYNCDQNEDQDRNGVPDIIEEAPILTGITADQYFEGNTDFINKNWSNCYFPKDLSFYEFEGVDLSYSDFSDAKLFNAIFNRSNLLGADLSNIDIRGSVFFFVRSIIHKF